MCSEGRVSWAKLKLGKRAWMKTDLLPAAGTREQAYLQAYVDILCTGFLWLLFDHFYCFKPLSFFFVLFFHMHYEWFHSCIILLKLTEIKDCLSGCGGKKLWDFKTSGVSHVIPLVWRQEELECINQAFCGAERKAALCELLEKETQIIASIGRHRHIAYMANQEAIIQTFLNKVSAAALV